jgi:sugar phosphate isomerase/epimerase
MTKRSLALSVITSSSSRELWDLFAEVRSIVGEHVGFDLYVLRETDARRIGLSSVPTGGLDVVSITEIMANAKQAKQVREWMIEQCRRADVRVPALATYFPDVTSLYKKRREVASRAILNSVLLALDLVNAGRSDAAIVEIVCGTVADPCECVQCQGQGKIYVAERPEKLTFLVEALRYVVGEVVRLQENGQARNAPFALGVEIEPGATYVLNDLSALNQFFSLVDAHQDAKLLKAHVGWNLDVAHARIVPIEAGELRAYVDRIVHSHIADHPRMHTRDQAVGSWSCVWREGNPFAPYISDLLLPRLNPGPDSLPFSGAIALELEGCNRLDWIYASTSAIRRLLSLARP